MSVGNNLENITCYQRGLTAHVKHDHCAGALRLHIESHFQLTTPTEASQYLTCHIQASI